MPGAVYLEGEDVVLRTIEEGDLPFLRDTINHPAVRRYLPSRLPINLEQEREFYETVVSDDGAANLLVCVDGEAVGTIGLEPADAVAGTGEIGLFLAPEFWGRGYGTEASRLVTDFAFAERRLHRVVARVLAPNVGSARIWETLGYRREATLREADFADGEYVDVYLFAVLEGEWSIVDGGD